VTVGSLVLWGAAVVALWQTRHSQESQAAGGDSTVESWKVLGEPGGRAAAMVPLPDGIS
jgi:hypothetical protein